MLAADDDVEPLLAGPPVQPVFRRPDACGPVTGVLVIGAGSIGARHARNLRAAGAAVAVTDPDAGRAGRVAADGGAADTCRSTLDRARRLRRRRRRQPDGAPRRHRPAAALAAGARVLVEKPLAVSTTCGLDRRSPTDRVMVGYNLRLHEPVAAARRPRARGRAGRCRRVRVWFGSWLPDWRPDVDYRTTYSAQADARRRRPARRHPRARPARVAASATATSTSWARSWPASARSRSTSRTPCTRLLRHRDGVVAEVSLDYLSRRVPPRHRGRRRRRRRCASTGRARSSRSRRRTASRRGRQASRRSRRTSARPSASSRSSRDGTPPPVDGAAGGASLRLAEQIRARVAVTHGSA